MNTNESSRIADELQLIRSELTLIRWVLVVGLVLAVLAIFGLGSVFGYVLSCILAAAILGPLAYSALFLIEKFVNWKAGTGHAEARMRTIIEEYEARDYEGADSNHEPAGDST